MVAAENITGLRVSMTSSNDPRFPAENILDGSTKSFWATTGLYPQEFVITLPASASVRKVIVWSSKVASWTLSKCTTDKPTDFDDVMSLESEDSDTNLQVTTFNIPSSSDPVLRHLKFTIRKGHLDFCSIHRVTVQGEVLGGKGYERASSSRGSERLNGPKNIGFILFFPDEPGDDTDCLLFAKEEGGVEDDVAGEGCWGVLGIALESSFGAGLVENVDWVREIHGLSSVHLRLSGNVEALKEVPASWRDSGERYVGGTGVAFTYCSGASLEWCSLKFMAAGNESSVVMV
ncbi:Heat shock protein beta-11 [Chytridiales sp. JEL 0842]|nr:Heat shock protein beta-11 [Chytridiales sp. JEL 0842]